MKINSFYIILLACCVTAGSCKKDNYSAPSSLLSGNLVYQGVPIGVEYGQVPFEIYQYGFGKVGPISSTINQDGSYSALLFNGSYKLDIPNGQGPFVWPKSPSGAPDSIAITLNGKQSLDLPVTPYYMIRNPQIAAAGGNVTATFKAEKIIVDPAIAQNIASVSLYINNTQFVSSTNKIAEADLAGGSIADPNNISLTVAIPASVAAQKYVYARIAIQIVNVEDRILSPLQKISF
jgi:hypothetical protein